MVTPPKEERIFAAIGNFDGVHLGHQYLISRLSDLAKSHDALKAIILFDPHPRRYFRPDDPPFLLMGTEQRDACLFELDVDQIHALPFDDEMANLSAEEFIRTIIVEDSGITGILVGSDFRFGKGRAGDGAFLKKIGAELGIEVVLVDPKALEESEGLPADEKIGSSIIREAIAKGDIKQATRMLGRPFAVSGLVETGQKLGRTIGFPTANLRLGEIVPPKYGVYAVQAIVNGKSHNGIANFGRKPTVGTAEPLLEVHLFDFDQNLYDQEIKVLFLDFIRDEHKFASIEALKAQITTDCDVVRALFS